jgi:hypothetical protein
LKGMPAIHRKARETVPATTRRCRRLGRNILMASTLNPKTVKDTTQYTT